MSKLQTTYMGLKLKSPIIAASCGLTNKLTDLKALEQSGAGAIVLKSLFEEEIVIELEREQNKMHSESYLYPETMDFYEDYDTKDTLTTYLKLIYEAKKIYDAHRKDLEKECSDDEFMAMYEQYEEFDDLEEAYMDMEEKVTAQLAEYVDEHLDQFAEVEQ